MPIKNLNMRLPSGGHIKMGELYGPVLKSQGGNPWRKGRTVDYFTITKLEREEEGIEPYHLKNYKHDIKLMDYVKANGGLVNKDGNLVGIPVHALYNDPDLIFNNFLVRRSGSKKACWGDGETATSVLDGQRKCPCARLEDGTDGACKYTGRLSIVISGNGADFYGMPFSGCHELRTAGKNSVECLVGSLAKISYATGGQIASMSLMLTIHPFQTQYSKEPKYHAALQEQFGRDFLIDEALRYRKEKAAQLEHMRQIERVISIGMKPFRDDEEEKAFAVEYLPGAPDEDEPAASEETWKEYRENQAAKAKAEEVTETEPAKEETDTPGILPLAVDEFKNLKQTGLREFVFENGDRIAAAPYEIAVEVFEKWGRIMGTERVPDDLWNSEHSRRYIEETSKAKEKAAAVEQETKTVPETKTEPTEPSKVEAQAGEKIPFGGKQKEITDIYKDALREDADTWWNTFASRGFIVPHAEIQTILKDPKSWNDPETWKAVLKRTNPDVDDPFICDITCKNQESRGAFARWHSTLAEVGAVKAGEMDTVQAEKFIRLNEIPF